MTDVYETLASLFEYPEDRWFARVESARGTANDPDSFAKFIRGIEALPLSDLQELYTRTFDLNPVCALEIGYHLFGENYKRGEFLANLRETEAPFELGQEHQLPDFLPVLLRLITKLEDEELRGSLISECLIPAIEKMLVSLKDAENPYRYLLEALRMTLQSEVGCMSIEAPRLNMRASLPVLANDLLNDPRRYEVAGMREFAAPIDFDKNRDRF